MSKPPLFIKGNSSVSIIHFRGKNYDANKVTKLSHLAHLEVVPTEKIATVASAKNFEAKIAIKVDNTYHLLTGDIDKNSSNHQLMVITKHALAKANTETSTYVERTMPRPMNPGQRDFRKRVPMQFSKSRFPNQSY